MVDFVKTLYGLLESISKKVIENNEVVVHGLNRFEIRLVIFHSVRLNWPICFRVTCFSDFVERISIWNQLEISFYRNSPKTWKLSRKEKMSENRKSSYKFGSKNADARRKNRQETSVALRKTAREEQMLKRRNVCMG